MRILGTVGLPGSGKGEAATVARDADIPVVTMGDVIRDACRERGLNPAEHHGTVAKRLREEDGPTAIADRTIDRLRDLDADVVLVDGLRSPPELERFREAFGEDFLLVAIEAPFDVRAERAADRGRDDSDADLEAFKEREEREKGFGLDDLMKRADVSVDNSGSLESFHDRIRSLLREGVVPEGQTSDSGTETSDSEAETTESETAIEYDR
jgi:dephospho-CoA kinase